ncbi:MAG: hypothetical protein ACP5UZ_08930 [Thermoplasmata archaeon]
MTRKLLELMEIINIKPEEVSDSIERDGNDSYNFNYNFDKRLRLQKMVYLIQHETKEFNYDFSLYLRGPYSRDLAREYYNLTNKYSESEEPLGPRSRELAAELSKRDNLWLEIASTIVMFSKTYGTEKAVERTKEFKEKILNSEKKPLSYVDSVFEDIRSMGLLETTGY